MAVEKVFEKAICKCERCGYVWMPKGDIPVTCAGCKSPYWNTLRSKGRTIIVESTGSYVPETPKVEIKLQENQTIPDNSRQVELVGDENFERKRALQCAILSGFQCEYKRLGVTKANLCKVCFTMDFWNKPQLIEKLTNAFSDEPEPVQPTAIKRVQANNNDEPTEEAKRFFEEIRSPVAPKPPTATGEPVEVLRTKCYLCSDKKKIGNKWECSHFDFRSIPHYPHCRLCWELEEIWQERAARPKPKKVVENENTIQ